MIHLFHMFIKEFTIYPSDVMYLTCINNLQIFQNISFKLPQSNKQVVRMGCVKPTNIAKQLIPKIWYKIQTVKAGIISGQKYINYKCVMIMDRCHEASIFLPIEDIPLQCNHITHSTYGLNYLQYHSYDPRSRQYTILLSTKPYTEEDIELSNCNIEIERVFTSEIQQLVRDNNYNSYCWECI